MATTDERLADVEARMHEQTVGMGDLSNQILALGHRFEGVEGGVNRLESGVNRLEGRIDRLDGKIDRLDGKIDNVRSELSSRIDFLDQKLDRRVDTLDAKVDRVMSFQVAMLLALVGWMITAFLRR